MDTYAHGSEGSTRHEGHEGDETAVAAREWFAEERENEDDEQGRDHLADLEASLLRPGVLDFLARYHLEVGSVLQILSTFRLRWSLDDPHLVFSYSVKDIETFPQRLETAANIVELTAPLVCQEWASDAEELQEETGGDLQALMRLCEGLGEVPTSVPEAKVHDELLRQQTRLEQLEVADLSLTLQEMGLAVRQAVTLSAAILRKFAATMRRIDWRTAQDGDERPIFGRHRRQRSFVERECARVLIATFEHETGRPLYDHVGTLLVATFPSLQGWPRRRDTRLRDRVKQLVGLRKPAKRRRGRVTRSHSAVKRR
jgi:hypothetical protein